MGKGATAGCRVFQISGIIYLSAVLKVPARLPAKVDLRPLCSKVEDQGQLGSCTANALGGGP